jgi:hypothetical protein
MVRLCLRYVQILAVQESIHVSALICGTHELDNYGFFDPVLGRRSVMMARRCDVKMVPLSTLLVDETWQSIAYKDSRFEF